MKFLISETVILKGFLYMLHFCIWYSNGSEYMIKCASKDAKVVTVLFKMASLDVWSAKGNITKNLKTKQRVKKLSSMMEKFWKSNDIITGHFSK